MNAYIMASTGPPYEEMDGKFCVDRSGSLRTIIIIGSTILPSISNLQRIGSLLIIVMAFVL